MKAHLIITITMLACAIVAPASAADQPAATPSAAAEANPAPPPSAPAKKSAEELEKLVEPIALHPDPLIAVILPASAYPLEIVQAARFVKDTNNIPKLDDQPWDDNVKEVAKFPEMIAKMDADLNWTTALGEAFVDQPKEVMDAIQALRAKAQKAGNLKTSEHQIVSVTNIVVMQTNVSEVTQVTKEIVQVAPANPQVVYVPTYPPAVYYPPPAYAVAAPLISFGVGMAWGAVLANNCNWGHGSVDVDVNRDVNRNVNRNTDRNRSSNRASSSARSGQQSWKPNQDRRAQNGVGASNRDARGYGSGGGRSSTANAGARPSTGNVGARPSTGNARSRPSANNASARSSGGSGGRPSTSQSSAGRSSASGGGRSSGGSAFSGSGSGSSARSSSARGSSSRGGGGGGGRSGGGRGGGGGGRR